MDTTPGTQRGTDRLPLRRIGRALRLVATIGVALTSTSMIATPTSVDASADVACSTVAPGSRA